MKIKRFFAALAACAVAAVSLTAVSFTGVSAAETQLTYTGPSTDAFSVNEDGKTLRLNIYNDLLEAPQSPVLDINNKGSFSGKISVSFTISGLNGAVNKNDDGTDGEAYKAELLGAVGTSQYWGSSAGGRNTVTNTPVTIAGNGMYTADFNIAQASDTITCLVLSTNINAYNYAASGKPADTGIAIKINRITVNDSATAGVQPNNNTNNLPGQNTTGGVLAGQTSGGGNVDSTNTGDKGIAVAVIGLAVCGVVAVIARRKNK